MRFHFNIRIYIHTYQHQTDEEEKQMLSVSHSFQSSGSVRKVNRYKIYKYWHKPAKISVFHLQFLDIPTYIYTNKCLNINIHPYLLLLVIEPRVDFLLILLLLALLAWGSDIHNTHPKHTHSNIHSRQFSKILLLRTTFNKYTSSNTRNIPGNQSVQSERLFALAWTTDRLSNPKDDCQFQSSKSASPMGFLPPPLAWSLLAFSLRSASTLSSCCFLICTHTEENGSETADQFAYKRDRRQPISSRTKPQREQKGEKMDRRADHFAYKRAEWQDVGPLCVYGVF